MALKPRKRLKHSANTVSFLDDQNVEKAPEKAKNESIHPDFQPHPGIQFRWFCQNCGEHLEGIAWWQTPGGIIRCMWCEPPNLPTTVVAMGDRADSPLVTAVYDRPGSPQPTAHEMKSWTKTRKFRWIRVEFLDRKPDVPAYWSDVSIRGRCLRCQAETQNIAPDGFCLACHAEDEEL